MKSFSVIIVTFNSGGTIGSCLDSVLSSLRKDDEIIVVDNGSSDNTPEIIRKNHPQVILVQNKRNAGYSSAADQGYGYSKGDCLLFLNPDAVLGTHSLEKLLNYFARNPEAAIIGCALIGHKGKPERSCWKTPCLKTIFLESILPYEVSLKLVTEKPAAVRRVEMVSGACMAVRREVFQSLGGFDERFFIYYEDADFCLRARSLDYGIYYFPEVQVVHRGRESFSDDLGMFFKMIYLSKIKFVKKHMKPAAAFLANVIIFGGILMRIPAYAIAGSVFFNMELLRLSKYHTFLLFWFLKGS